MADIHKEFQRVFEFFVKHGVQNPLLTNAQRKRFLRWAWDKRHLLVVYDGAGEHRRIAGAAIVWRTDHPENSYRDFSDEATNQGDYLHVYHAVVHPEYRRQGCLLLLLALAVQEHPGARKIFWNSHSRGRDFLRITDIQTLGKELLKWDYQAAASQISRR